MSATIALPGVRMIVTGGTRGIGRAIVEAAAAAGARCGVLHRSAGGADDVRRHCADNGWPVPLSRRADVTDDDGCSAAVRGLAAELGGVDVVVNNAARVAGNASDGLFTATDDLLRSDFEEKVVAYRRVVRVAYAFLLNSPHGRVVNIGGEAAHIARDNISSGVRNAAVVHLTHTMAMELGPDGITVNAIQPGLVLTDDVRGRLLGSADGDAEQQERTLRQLSSRHALRRFVEPHEVAAVAMFLASSASSGMTAQVLTVSAGSTRAVHY